MDVTALINDLESRGIALWVNGDRLNYRSTQGFLARRRPRGLKVK